MNSPGSAGRHGRSPTDLQPAIVYGAHDPVSLGLMQSLHRDGIPVVALSPDSRAMGFRSRYCDARFVCPNPRDSPSQCIDFLLREVPRGVLIPFFDTYSLLLSRHQAQLEDAGFTCLLTEYEHMVDVVFKDRLWEVAGEDPDLPVPRTKVVDSRTIESAAELLGFPLILKVIRTKHTAMIRSRSEVRSVYRTLVRRLEAKKVASYRIVAQKWIPGDELCHVGMLSDGSGRPVSGMVGRRRRCSYTPLRAERACTMLEWVDEPDLLERAQRFVAAHKLRGLVELDCKLNPDDGRYQLLDVNPRVWAWIGYTVSTKLNYPAGYYWTALGEAWNPVRVIPSRRHYLLLAASSPYQSDIVAAVRQWQYGYRGFASIARSYLRLLRHPRDVVVGYGNLHDLRPLVSIARRAVADILHHVLGKSLADWRSRVAIRAAGLASWLRQKTGRSTTRTAEQSPQRERRSPVLTEIELVLDIPVEPRLIDTPRIPLGARPSPDPAALAPVKPSPVAER